jgi:hypothetical protein
LRPRQEFVFKSRDACRLSLDRRLFLACSEREGSQPQAELVDVPFAGVEPGIELAFAQGKHVGADFEVLFELDDAARLAVEFLRELFPKLLS